MEQKFENIIENFLGCKPDYIEEHDFKYFEKDSMVIYLQNSFIDFAITFVLREFVGIVIPVFLTSIFIYMGNYTNLIISIFIYVIAPFTAILYFILRYQFRFTSRYSLFTLLVLLFLIGIPIIGGIFVVPMSFDIQTKGKIRNFRKELRAADSYSTNFMQRLTDFILFGIPFMT